MSALVILIIISTTVAALFLIAFIWSVRSGQYEDEYTPSVRILFEDEKPTEASDQSSNDLNIIESEKSNKS